MTTSDSSLKERPRGGGSAARVFVIVALVGAIGFGSYIGYLAWTNDSFPTQEKPFQDYASVASSTFNGTELAFRLQWLNSDYVPYQAQLTSSTSDAANTPVCAVQLGSIRSGETIFLPFTVASPKAALSDVDLSLAVRPVGGGSDFTIVYTLPSVSATNGNIVPSNVTCQQPPGGE